MKIELLEPAYEGMAKLLLAFVELYKVCDNKELIDKCLEKAFIPPYLLENNEIDKEESVYKSNPHPQAKKREYKNFQGENL